MAYPPGVTTCPVSIKAPVTFGGTNATVYLEVTPGVRLIHTATGQTLADFTELSAPSVGGVATVTLPHSQPGFQDEAGNAVLSWPYTAKVRFEHAGKAKHGPPRAFTILPEQTAVDLALIPAGPASPVLTAPAAAVSSVNGATGAVDTYLQLARAPEALIVGTIVLDDGAPVLADVVWPDGTEGVFTGTPSVAFPGSLDSYTITYGTTRTYTQPTVTRDVNGDITDQPAIVLS